MGQKSDIKAGSKKLSARSLETQQECKVRETQPIAKKTHNAEATEITKGSATTDSTIKVQRLETEQQPTLVQTFNLKAANTPTAVSAKKIDHVRSRLLLHFLFF